MEIKQINYFLEIVASNFNISSASKKLFISQSTLSQSMIQFENDYQAQLFKREKGRLIGLTDLGQAMYKYAQEIQKLHQEMMQLIDQDKKETTQIVRIGIPPILVRTRFPRFLLNMKQLYPDLRIEYIEEGCQRLCQLLENKEIDIAFLTDPLPTTKLLNSKTAIKDEFVLFMDKNHPLTKQNQVKWSSLNQYSSAIFTDAYSTHHFFMIQCQKERIAPKIFLESNSWEYLIDTIKNSQLITFLPKSVYPMVNRRQITYRPFERSANFKIFISTTDEIYQSAIKKCVYDALIDYCSQVEAVANLSLA